MWDTTQRQASFLLMGAMCLFLAAMIVGNRISPRLYFPEQEPLFIGALGLSLGLWAAYWRGWEYARHTMVMLCMLATVFTLDEPFLRSFFPHGFIITPILALVLVSPAWVMMVAVTQWVLAAARAGFVGVFVNPPEVLAYALSVAGLLLSRAIVETAQRQAETNARRAEVQAAELRAKEEALRASQANLTALIENTHDSIWSVDRHYRLIISNSAFRAVQQALLGREIAAGESALDEGFGESLCAMWRRCYDRALLGERFTEEMQFQWQTGDVYLENSFSPIADSAGQATGVVVLSRNITERKRIENALRQNEARFRALIQNSSDVVILIRPDGTLTYISPSVTRMLGYDPAEVVGRRGRDFVHPDDLPPLLAFFSGLTRHAGRVYTVNVRLHHRNGLWRWHEATGTNLLDDPAVGAIVINSRDIHERHMAEQMLLDSNEQLERRVQERTAQLEESNRELEAFSYSVSHDLRAPLRTINGFTRVLMEDYNAALPPEAQRYLQRVSNGAAHMGELIDDLLTFSRLGRQPLHKQRVAVAEVVERAIEDLQPEYQDRQVEFRVGPLPECQADAALLRQVFVNLIGNAVKFTREQAAPQIEVGCLEGEPPVFFVRDNGIGFDPQYRDKLFNVFQRLHTAEEYEGTGVGLAIVHRIVRRHGGRVWAEAWPGQGATFYFSLEG